MQTNNMLEENLERSLTAKEDGYKRKGISFTMLSDFLSNPRMFKDLYITCAKKKKETEAMRFGTKLHTYLLENAKMITRYVHEDELKEAIAREESFLKSQYAEIVKKRFFEHPLGEKHREKYADKKITKALNDFKEFLIDEKVEDFVFEKEAFVKEFLGRREIITESDITLLKQIKAEFDERMLVSFGERFISHIQVEQKFTWIDPVTKLPCVTKLDILVISKDKSGNIFAYIIEVKSINELKRVAKYGKYKGVHFKFEERGYYEQMIFQREGVHYNLKIPIENIKNYFIELETTGHNYGHVWQPSERLVEAAYKHYIKDLRSLKECLTNNKWRNKGMSLLGEDIDDDGYVIKADVLEPSDRMIEALDYEETEVVINQNEEVNSEE